MGSRLTTILDYMVGILTITLIALLSWLTNDPLRPDLTWLVFISLSAFTSAFAVPLGGGFMSMLPLTAISALLILGTVQAGFVAVSGEILFGLFRWRFARWLGKVGESKFSEVLRLTSANLAIQGLSVIIAGTVYSWLRGKVPLSTFTPTDFSRFLVTVITYLFVNYALISGHMRLRSPELLQTFLSKINNLIVIEGLPVVFAPLMAMIYAWMGLPWMTLFALNYAAASLIGRSLAGTTERLERRVKELDTLQAVGKTLSSTLNLEIVLNEIYRLISELMPADVFYIALYDPSLDRISFPLVLENGIEVQWKSRQAGPGATEYVIRTRRPLLISRRVIEQLKSLGVTGFGKEAESWLGAPMLVGDEVIGVVAVQSYTMPGVYTPAFEQVLVTVAAQAGMAIHNARLYARIDETLESRVRELNSILHATADGIILFDLDMQILAANTALGEMLGIEAEDLPGHSLRTKVGPPIKSLLECVGYTDQSLETDLQALMSGQSETIRQLVQRESYAFRRVLTPVRSRDGRITGWLLVLNDRTEERELEILRDDMLHMVVHDLRAPVTTLLGSMAMLRENDPQKSNPVDANVFINIAERSGERLLGLISTILEINRLENKSFPVAYEPLNVADLLNEVAMQVQPAVQDAQVDLVIELPADLPRLNVDKELITRVLYNLVDNAIKFSPDQTQVRIGARRIADDGWLELFVIDKGRGISSEILANLFNKFQRDRTIKTRRSGTGLGLYFCRLAVEAHGGRIWVESQVGEGSSFSLLLPVECDEG